MAIATTGTASNYLQRAPSPSGLAEVLDLTQTELAGLPELQEKGSEEMTKGAIEGAEDKLLPSSSTLRKAAKGAAAAAAVGAAAAAAKQLGERFGGDEGSSE